MALALCSVPVEAGDADCASAARGRRRRRILTGCRADGGREIREARGFFSEVAGLPD